MIEKHSLELPNWDWQDMIASCLASTETHHTNADSLEHVAKQFLSIGNQAEHDRLMEQVMTLRATYDLTRTEWDFYDGGFHFQDDRPSEIAELMDQTLLSYDVSRIQPGFIAPWHQDPIVLNDPRIQRWTLTITDPVKGQFVQVEDQVLVMPKRNTLYRWLDPMAEHGAANFSMQDYWLLHLLTAPRGFELPESAKGF
jgi:hypothetical protein